jgi:small-conductance mechanosensitive channel
MEAVVEFLRNIRAYLGAELAQLGTEPITLWGILSLLALALLLIYGSNQLRRWVRRRMPSEGVDVAAREAVATLVHYLVLVIGFVVILQMVGIDLTILSVLTGTVGIGIGFGLQNIVNNFVSGLIILFERPIGVGDRIEVGGVHGRVTRIGARSSTVLTNDNVAIIIPNSKLIAENVINWSHGDGRRRFGLPVSVPPGSDLHQVERLLIEAALSVPEVLREPAPGVRFLGFNESGLHFEVRAWTRELIQRRGLLTSKVYFAVHDAFVREGIGFPNPRRDVFIVSTPHDPSLPPDGLPD